MSPPDRVELRPAYLEDWLETLPYADFQKTVQILVEALANTNHVRVKASIRLELLDLYARAYLYLLNSYVKGQTMAAGQQEIAQQNIQAIREFVVELARGYRMAVADALNAPSSWWQPKKPPTRGCLMGIKCLSHLLLLDYHAYAPLLPDIWREIHGLYLQAEALGEQEQALDDPEREPPAKTTIRLAYLQILTTALVDPYRLPFGAIWEIYEQLHDWVRDARLDPYETVKDPRDYFVIDLTAKTPPIAYEKYTPAQTTAGLRLLNCTPLWEMAQRALDDVRNGQKTSLVLSSHLAVPILEQMLATWWMPLKRQVPRAAGTNAVRVVYGFNTVYGMIAAHVYSHGQRVSGTKGATENIVMDWLREAPAGGAAELWDCIDETPGGMAAYHSAQIQKPMRVGELIAVRHSALSAEEDWTLGVVRWLIVEADGSPRIGIQMLPKDPQPVAVRATQGGTLDVQYRRGFLLGIPGQDPELSLITPPGLFANGRCLEIRMGERPFEVHAWTLHEATVAFEQFSCTPLPEGSEP